MTLPDIAEDAAVRDLVRRAIEEDVGSGDATTAALVPSTATGEAVIVSRGDYIVSGTGVAAAVFRGADPRIECAVVAADGTAVKPDGTVMTIDGPAGPILTAERTALNFLQRMTGIASLAARFVAVTEAHGVQILDTRKTTPTLRALEKYAVLCGGGHNHRMGLYDRVLIKDNHRRLWNEAEEGLARAVEVSRGKFPDIPVEIEVESEQQLEDALEARPDWVLLDNMGPDQLRSCVQICAGRSRLEASGGITLANVEEIAKTGVDAISLGCLTHSAAAADLSLEMVS